MPFGFHFAVDTLPSRELQGTGSRSTLAVSGFRLRARLGLSIPLPSLAREALPPAFGYCAPHSSVGRTLTLMNIRCSAHNMPFADFCSAVRSSFNNLSRRSDTEQISWGKLNRLPCTAAGSTLRIFDGYGLRGKFAARPTLTPCIRFLSIDSHILFHASFRPRLAAVALAFSLALHLLRLGRGLSPLNC
jgi:hypothetical protein